LLNIHSLHPNERIRSDPGEPYEKDKNQNVRPLQTLLSEQQNDSYLASGGRFFTRPLIHYDMALFLAPMEMAGAVLGVLIQKILPNWLYLLLAAVILGITSYKTFLKYLTTRKTESRTTNYVSGTTHGGSISMVRVAVVHNNKPEYDPLWTDNDETGVEAISICADVLDPLASAGRTVEPTAVDTDNTWQPGSRTDPHEQHLFSEIARTISNASSPDSSLSLEEQYQRRCMYLEIDSEQYPRRKIGYLGILWIGLLILTFLKGGKGVESIIGITCQSPFYTVLVFLQFAWMLGFACVFGWKLSRDEAARGAVAYPFLEDDPRWDRESLKAFGSATFGAGIVAGLIGVGGGMVLGPLMLEMGVNPRVSSATTATMIVLTSSSVCFVVVTSGMLDVSYLSFYFCVCFFGSMVGKSQIDGYVKKTGKTSLLVLILATIIAFATVGCLVIMTRGLMESQWCFEGLSPFCQVSQNSAQNCPSEGIYLAFSQEGVSVE
jgi:uncharacterized membrane protein YfcA